VISILIRTKNEAAWIGRTLEAVLKQDHTDREIIVVDSGSEDETLAIAGRYPVRLLQIPRESFSPGRALNTGAQAARGDSLVSLSAHAVPADPSWLSRLAGALEDPLVAGAASRQRPHAKDRLDGYRALWQGLYSLGIRTPTAERYLFSNAASAFRAGLWRRYGFDEDLGSCEDHLWALQMQHLGYGVRYVPSSVVLHSHHLPFVGRARRGRSELAALGRVYGGAAHGAARSGMRLSRRLRAAALLARYGRRARNPGPWGTRRETGRGTAFELYEPVAPARRTVLLVPGFTMEGEHDSRLVAFAESLCESGVRAVVPILPGLKSFQFLEEDLKAVEDVVAERHAQEGRPVALAAFSVGGVLALAACATQSLVDAVDRVLLISPSCDVESLWEGFRETCGRSPVTEKEWDHAIFVRAALAYRCRSRMDFAPTEERDLVAMLASYCHHPPLEEKKAFYERVLRSRERDVLALQTLEQEVVHALYTQAQLAQVRSRVLILHDPFDHVVPPNHAERLYGTLQRREGSGGERLVFTSFLAHASERRGWGIGDAFSGLAALDLIGELLE
jgi:rhamnosyltransferase